eukprot:TRINITY_DN3306_c1_g1_i5.p1 TRINITY_DN3306_c1_g1~~TRINITY_DN3306_c1_g1_i5.p1  ORF type:complete len:185 (-),score=54.43 TRINITY_DN3306_c1_g1_i5:80-589(-)
MGTSLASVGGLCVGSVEVVNHQRLSGSGYCFSASLPPYLAVVADEALNIIENNPKKLASLRSKACYARKGFEKIRGIECSGTMESPIIHVRLSGKSASLDRSEQDAILSNVVQHARESSQVLFTPAQYNALKEGHIPAPSIRINVSDAHSNDDIDTAVKALQSALQASI